MKCLNNNLNWVVSWSVVVAMLFALGCSGTAVSPLGNAVETDVDEIGYAAVMTPDGAITVSSPPSLRNTSELGDLRELIEEANPGLEGIHDSLIESVFESMHIPLVSGENEVDVTDFLFACESAYVDHSDVYLNYLVLDSEPGTTSFATFGFRDIPEGEYITRVELIGTGSFGDGASCGLYIGIGDPDMGTYEWAGPFKNGEDWALNIWFMDNTTALQRAYVTLLVANNDDAEIYQMKVYVNGMPEIHLEEQTVLQKIPFDDPFPYEYVETPGGIGGNDLYL